jgi:starch phosphorylase
LTIGFARRAATYKRADLFYQDRDRYIDLMRHAIALNGSFFNAQRMLLQYIAKAYFV